MKKTDDRLVAAALYGGGVAVAVIFLGISLCVGDIIGPAFRSPAFVVAVVTILALAGLSAVLAWPIVDWQSDKTLPLWIHIHSGLKLSFLVAIFGLLVLAILFSVADSRYAGGIWSALVTLALVFSAVAICGQLAVNVWLLLKHRKKN